MNRSATFIRGASLDDLSPLHGTLVTIEGNDISLFIRGNEVHAISNVCAHQHRSMLHKGEFDGCVVTCPMHGWSFDVRSGKATKGHGVVRSYPVEIRGREVFIQVDDPFPE